MILFEVVFDYGEHDAARADPVDTRAVARAGPDPFSSYRAGFEMRTYRLCHRVLMFHRMTELGAEPVPRALDRAHLRRRAPS